MLKIEIRGQQQCWVDGWPLPTLLGLRSAGKATRTPNTFAVCTSKSLDVFFGITQAMDYRGAPSPARRRRSCGERNGAAAGSGGRGRGPGSCRDRNGERRMGNRARAVTAEGTGNRERGSCRHSRRNGEQGTGTGEQGPGLVPSQHRERGTGNGPSRTARAAE